MRRSEDLNTHISSSKLSLRKCISTATWNVKELVLHHGKLDILDREVLNFIGNFTSNIGYIIYRMIYCRRIRIGCQRRIWTGTEGILYREQPEHLKYYVCSPSKR